MSSIVPEPVKNAFRGDASAKHHQLQANIVEPTQDTRITSDFGTKQTNTDDWLRVNRDDQIGPSLLEDPFGREKVCIVVFMGN
jgi:catalase